MPNKRRTWIGLAIILLVALFIVASPKGAGAQNLVSSTIQAAFLAALAFAGVQLYRDQREWLSTLDDRNLGAVYGAIAIALLAIVGVDRFHSLGGIGNVLLILLLAACAGVVYWVWRDSRRWTI
jgi:drug/metabolite transporter (DMT)-like permease